MTETTCPTCGAKCEEWTQWNLQAGTSRLVIKALPTTDLTRLREAWEECGLNKGLNTDLFISGDKRTDHRMRRALLQAVKELLEGDK